MKLSKILLEENQPTIEELQKQVQGLENRYEYEVNLYERQAANLKSDIVKGLSRDLKLEIETLEIIANRLTSDQSKDLKMSISNIKKLLSDERE